MYVSVDLFAPRLMMRLQALVVKCRSINPKYRFSLRNKRHSQARASPSNYSSMRRLLISREKNADFLSRSIDLIRMEKSVIECN